MYFQEKLQANQVYSVQTIKGNSFSVKLYNHGIRNGLITNTWHGLSIPSNVAHLCLPIPRAQAGPTQAAPTQAVPTQAVPTQQQQQNQKPQQQQQQQRQLPNYLSDNELMPQRQRRIKCRRSALAWEDLRYVLLSDLFVLCVCGLLCDIS